MMSEREHTQEKRKKETKKKREEGRRTRHTSLHLINFPAPKGEIMTSEDTGIMGSP
jgi:hypothetical protein